MGLNHLQGLICTYRADDLRPLMLLVDKLELLTKLVLLRWLDTS